ncbi:MAG: non-hydrolyzing UDP-N-acetylglucosamine 2-epimerase [Blastocatellia bacterium]
MMKVVNIVGARPNFMKMAPIIGAMNKRRVKITQVLVHTGQHYDEALSGAFFRDLEMPAPDLNLDVRGGSHAEQTARVMLAFEPVLDRHAPDWVVVVGDVNSTLACALVAAKRGIRVAHVESGLRSFDRAMPEEINRVLTDRISDLLLTPSADADLNLLREGIEPHRIVRVGNVMIDTLVRHFELAKTSPILDTFPLEPCGFAVATLHRPANVDDPEVLRGLLSALGEIARELPVIIPTHPRTQARIEEFGIELPAGLTLIEPLGYRDFLKLWSNSRMVLTDSGGLQEETTALGIPCLTLRDNTERPITIQEGTNRLVGRSPQRILAAAGRILRGQDASNGRRPELWDGHAADRIVQTLLNFSQHAPGNARGSGLHRTASPFSAGD